MPSCVSTASFNSASISSSVSDAAVGGAPPARGVDQASPRGLRQPALRIRGHALIRPDGERGCEGLGERILRAGHVARRHREIGHELAVAFARHARRRGAGVSLAVCGDLGAVRRRRARRAAQFGLRLGHINGRRDQAPAEIRLCPSRGQGAARRAAREDHCPAASAAGCFASGREAADQIDERPESDNRRQGDREGREAPVVDQIAAVKRRLTFDPAHRSLRAALSGHICQIGRTSIAPYCAPGQRAAQEIAASRSGASIRK